MPSCRTPFDVRRVVEISARWLASGHRGLVAIAVGLALAMALATRVEGLIPDLSYDVAFMALAATLARGLHRAAALERVAWNLGDGGRAAVVLASLTLELAIVALLAGAVARLTDHPLPATSLLGVLHLVAIGLLITRLPLRPAASVYVFLAAIWVVPALVPALRPILEIRHWFHPGGFPGWIEAISPILALALGACALPARAPSAIGTSSA